MTFESFSVSIEQSIATITLNRPEKRNCMSRDFWADLPKIIRDIDGQAKARVIVMMSTGPVFSAGIDTAMLMEVTAKGEVDEGAEGADFLQTLDYLQETFSVLETCRLPVIAAVQGAAIGAAVDLLTACDLRYATQNAYFTIQEINLGLTADVGTFPRICNLLPEGIVKDLAFTGRALDAEEARSVGFLNGVYQTPEALHEGVLEIARVIAQKAPLAIYGSKQAIHYARDHSTSDSLKFMGYWNASMLNKKDVAEAFMAMSEKRDGNFARLPKIRRHQK